MESERNSVILLIEKMYNTITIYTVKFLSFYEWFHNQYKFYLENTAHLSIEFRFHLTRIEVSYTFLGY
jgi:hypothetical protein